MFAEGRCGDRVGEPIRLTLATANEIPDRLCAWRLMGLEDSTLHVAAASSGCSLLQNTLPHCDRGESQFLEEDARHSYLCPCLGARPRSGLPLPE